MASTEEFAEGVPSEADTPPYVFDLGDEERWLAQLRDHGFVVLRGVADELQVGVAEDQLWDAICERQPETVRDDPRTWNWRCNQAGIVPWLAQSAGAWSVRGWPGVKKAFAKIWQTEELIVSMDCVIVWRPWWLNGSWRPQTEGLHLDQNPFSKPMLECVQGMVPLKPVTAATGGLQVVPDSHLDCSKEAFKATHIHMRSTGDWCPCDDDDLREQALLLLAEPGDLILWDSRTIHGGIVGSGKVESPELARLSVTVAMTPRTRASARVLTARKEGFEKGINFNHSPHEAGTSTGTFRAPARRGYRPPELTKEQRDLL